MTLKQAIRYRVLQLCADKHITVNALSNQAGIAPSTLKSLVSKQGSDAQASTIKKICDAFEITLATFYDVPLFNDLEQYIK